MAQAQRSHLGFGVGLLPSSTGVLPLLSAHVGFPLAENLTLRASLDSLLLINDLGADVLYSFPLEESWRGYAGAGPNLVLSFFSGYEFHATLGAERDLGRFGLFGEVQPQLVFGDPLEYGFKFRLGGLLYF